MLVRHKVCDQCLLSTNKVVADNRRDQLLDSCNQTGKAFEFHKGTIVGKHIVCRVFFYQNLSLVVRLAKILDKYQFINESEA